MPTCDALEDDGGDGGEGDDDLFGKGGLVDDFDKEDLTDGASSDGAGEEEEEEEADEGKEEPARRDLSGDFEGAAAAAAGSGSGSSEGGKKSKEAAAGKGKGGGKGSGDKAGGGDGDGSGQGELTVDAETPPSFSHVPLGDPRVSDAQLAAQWPAFPGRGAALEVTVEAGCMLYLPAGWFHEVTSFGAAGSGSESGSGGHLAFNYWFHPPDNLDPSRSGFRAPYKSDYWPALWRSRVAAGLPGGLEPGMGAQRAPSEAGKAEEHEEAEADLR
ncbi:hypothetical protein GPECTOR_16g545 [Gonium pectorale]|uniref:JmjC domain-containing protein n=1 Tax=Gonium pectorale TaxID=33097 RepID=A0A150GKN8_GONPE|nr:hypothetical protein GPECTOR_16g545 [Gonium pectorale]|eukprot:KXZ50372.1 hypothetical protein GPECTOR_16g545 [Gonium pectorale]